MLGITRLTQVRAGIRSSTLREQSKIRDADPMVRPDGQISSRSPSRKDIMLFVSLERTESTGQLWLARGTNGARSVHPEINGSQGDQGGQVYNILPYPPQ
ncbi:hypothetical protein ANCDUO_01321 [Ancylostoma duodenale]|uniref:Uncharacterized protein n=1 Tax=Ancylostoma duodenale TaxID=51022 RepID=A0A0C2DZ71_9BILA|nr:hypothetical protein ANCDUO_01321 [Ancylostoma duodenale]